MARMLVLGRGGGNEGGSIGGDGKSILKNLDTFT